MAAVTANLGNVPDDDIRAMATYVAAQMEPQGSGTDAREGTVLKDADPHVPGATPAVAGSQAVPVKRADSGLGASIYAAACSSCHDAGRSPPFGGIKLDLSSAMNGPDPTNPIHVILHGLPGRRGRGWRDHARLRRFAER